MPACPYCGGVLTSTNPRAVYCGRRCKELAKQRRDRARAEKHPRNARCGTHSGYVLHRRRGEDACVRCKAASAKYYRSTERVAVRNDVAHRRRVRLRGGAHEPISREEIFERDGWLCGICGDPVDREATWPDLMSASLDHIVPVSHGGMHVMSNVQCSHLRCNFRKGAKVAAQEVSS